LRKLATLDKGCRNDRARIRFHDVEAGAGFNTARADAPGNEVVAGIALP
jgi:hypothetical protein